MLRTFINSGECLDATESSLVISKEQSGEMEKGKELLTIKEMVDRSFSQSLVLAKLVSIYISFLCVRFFHVCLMYSRVLLQHHTFTNLSVSAHILRAKIDAILRKNEAVPDEDAPDDAASTRFWCFTGGKYTDREKVMVKGSSNIGVKSTASGIAALLDSSGMPGACVAGSPTTPSSVSLSTLVGIAKESERGDAQPKAKAKAKAKGKGKKVQKEDPLTPKEKKEAARTLAN